MALEDGRESASGEELCITAARASVARPPRGSEICTLGAEKLALWETSHLHFQTSVQLHGLSKESTRELFQSWAFEKNKDDIPYLVAGNREVVKSKIERLLWHPSNHWEELELSG